MARISTFRNDNDYEAGDRFSGLDATGGDNVTYTMGGVVTFAAQTLGTGNNIPEAADDAAAATAGVNVGGLYHNGGIVRIRLA